MSAYWLEITCKSPAELVEQLADFLVTLSGGGVCIENLELDTFSLETLQDSPVKMVKAYIVADDFLQEKIDAISAYMETHINTCSGFEPAPLAMAKIREEDWANNWKIHFKPSRVGRRIIIKPTWEEFAAAGDEVILELDPGMAFGTGTHPTSRLCLETLERIFNGEPPFIRTETKSPLDILDVGTGSGILAIAAAKLGAVHVAAIDIDPKAVEVARQNAELNRVSNTVEVRATPIEAVKGDFSVVIANILAEDLVRMAADLVSKIGDKGFLVLSGILNEKEGVVFSGFSGFPLLLLETSREGEWSCITYRLQR